MQPTRKSKSLRCDCTGGTGLHQEPFAMTSLAQQVSTVNPRKVNPFNTPDHRFVPGDDPEADARYLRAVLDGQICRYYVTVRPSAIRSGRYLIVVVDRHNGNILLCKPEPPADRFTRSFGSMAAKADALRKEVERIASENGFDVYYDFDHDPLVERLRTCHELDQQIGAE